MPLDAGTARQIRNAAAPTWLDRTIGWLSPRAQLGRHRARLQLALMQASYDAASVGRRTQGWRRAGGDANAATGPALSILRDRARDLVRNNPYAESALLSIVGNTVGWGIRPSVRSEAWEAWAESTACDADGRNDFAGIQKLVMRTTVEAGECLVRRRIRLPEDKLPIPMQLQVVEPDYLDVSRDGTTPNGGRIVQGVEFNAIGRRVGYWLFDDHPGTTVLRAGTRITSHRVPAGELLHVYRQERPGQVRGITWFARIMLRIRDLDEYEDATLMKQKVAALLAIVSYDENGTAEPLGTVTDAEPAIDTLEPGMILNRPIAGNIEVVQPPSVNEHDSYTRTNYRGIAAGMGITYEDLTGDYANMPFSAARMSRIRAWQNVEDWRWRLIVPQLLNPVWSWSQQMIQASGGKASGRTEWTAPPMPMIEPDKEGLAYMRNIRAGIMTPSEALRERGYQIEQFWDEYARDLDGLDRRGIVLDSDARQLTQAGQRHKDAGAAGDNDSAGN